jgi:putative flippase GtrA
MPQLSKLYFKFRNHFAGHLPQTYYLCEKHKTLVKCFFAGFTAGVIDLVFLFIFHHLFSWPIVMATSVAFVSSFAVSFTLQKFWTFRDFNQEKAAGQFTLYILNAFVGLNLNGFFMHMLVNRHHIWYLLAQLMVNMVIGTYNFFIYRYVVFKKEKNEINHEQKTVRGGAGNLA